MKNQKSITPTHVKNDNPEIEILDSTDEDNLATIVHSSVPSSSEADAVAENGASMESTAVGNNFCDIWIIGGQLMNRRIEENRRDFPDYQQPSTSTSNDDSSSSGPDLDDLPTAVPDETREDTLSFLLENLHERIQAGTYPEIVRRPRAIPRNSYQFTPSQDRLLIEHALSIKYKRQPNRKFYWEPLMPSFPGLKDVKKLTQRVGTLSRIRMEAKIFELMFDYCPNSLARIQNLTSEKIEEHRRNLEVFSRNVRYLSYAFLPTGDMSRCVTMRQTASERAEEDDRRNVIIESLKLQHEFNESRNARFANRNPQ